MQEDSQKQNPQTSNLAQLKANLIAEIRQRVEDKIIEENNAKLLEKLITNAENKKEALSIAALGTTYKRTGFHFDKRLEVQSDAIHYLAENKDLSFKDSNSALSHSLIIGDNYPALLNLLIHYKQRVKVIYIDPPYGKDDLGEFANTNYNNAISRDNLLSMLYPRLHLAKELLKDDGVIFCSIDDRNQAYVKCLFDEVFGERNFVACMPRVTKKAGKSTDKIANNHDYILCYQKNTISLKQIEVDENNYKEKDEFFNERGGYKLNQTLDYDSLSYSKNGDYEIEINGSRYYPGGDFNKFLNRQNGNYNKLDWVWRWRKEKLKFGLENGFIEIRNNRIYTKTYAKATISKTKPYKIEYFNRTKNVSSLEFTNNQYSNDNANKRLQNIFNVKNIFDYSKSVEMIKFLISQISTTPNTANNVSLENEHLAGGGAIRLIA